MQNSNQRQELQKLLNSVGPNLITLYKTYLIYYANWCKDKDLLSSYSNKFKSLKDKQLDSNDEIDDEAVIYKHLPISSKLIHKFLIDILIKKQIGLDENNDILGSLSQWIMGLIFIAKLCDVYGNPMIKETPLNEKYLYQIIDLHKYGKDQWLQVPVYQISINSWNPNTKNLNPIHFKTANEKLRFLVDFHFATYLRLNFGERSNLKLCSLITKKGHNINARIAGSSDKLDIIFYDPHMNSPPSQDYKPMALLPHQSPFLCPYTSLASYLFIRFYGIQYFSKGEGFPDLFDGEYIQNMPLITNKANNEYPKETAISICYSTMFKYCNQPYKKKAYFERLSPIAPSWTSVDEYFEFKQALGNDVVPWDYINILNGYSPYTENIDIEVGIQSNTPSQDIVALFFPEVEKYKARSDRLDLDSQKFLNLLETIRTKFVLDLPVIFKVFPQHDIFINPIFKDPKIQYYLNGIQLHDHEPLPFPAKLPINSNGNDQTTLFDLYKKLTDKPSFLEQMEEITQATSNQTDVPSTKTSLPLNLSSHVDFRRNIKSTVTINNQEELLEELRKENFKFIQYQTLYNFESFVDLVSKIFNRLSLKETSKLEIERAMEHYKELLQNKIQESTPNDIKQYFIDNPESKTSSQKKLQKSTSDSNSDSDSDSDFEALTTKKQASSFKVFSVAGQSSDEEDSESETFKTKGKRKRTRHKTSDVSEDEVKEEEESDDDEEEDNDANEEEEDQEEQLKYMIDELVTSKVETLLRLQMDMLESKIESVVDEIIESKLESKFDMFIENRMKRTVENYLRNNEIESNTGNGVKKTENNFAQRVQNRTAAMFDTREDGLQDTFQSEFSLASPTNVQENTSMNESIHNDISSNINPLSDVPTSNKFGFHMDPSLDKIEDVILEWFSPNPTMNNECIHSMNKKYGKTWRLKNDSIYKIRKNIVDFYVYLTNVESVDKLQAISYCKNLQGDRSMGEFSKYLRTYKKSHNSSFSGLYQS